MNWDWDCWMDFDWECDLCGFRDWVYGWSGWVDDCKWMGGFEFELRIW